MFGYLITVSPVFLTWKKKEIQWVIQPYSFAMAIKEKVAQGYRRKLLLMLCLLLLCEAGKESC